MPVSVPARQVRLGNKKVRFMVKKRISRGILKLCWVCDHARRCILWSREGVTKLERYPNVTHSADTPKVKTSYEML